MSAEEFGATGMWIDDRSSRNEPLRTGMIWTNSPADKAGIKPGLFLISVNSTNVVSKTVAEVSKMIRGPVGKELTLEVSDAKRAATNRVKLKRGRAVIRNNQVVEITE